MDLSLTEDDFEVYDDYNDECIHEWVEVNKTFKVCSLCGEQQENNKFAESGDIDESIYKEVDQINFKVNGNLRRFNNWHNGLPFDIKSFNADLEKIEIISLKVKIPIMIAQDAQLIYKKFKELLGDTKYITKSSTKKDKIDTMNKFTDEKMRQEVIINNCKLRGDSRIGLLCACIYYACFKNELCVLCSTLANAAEIKPKYVHKGCNSLLQIRSLFINEFKILIPKVCLPYPIDYFNTMINSFKNLYNIEFDDLMLKDIKLCLINAQHYLL